MGNLVAWNKAEVSAAIFEPPAGSRDSLFLSLACGFYHTPQGEFLGFLNYTTTNLEGQPTDTKELCVETVARVWHKNFTVPGDL
jgi:hypothetical protein